MKVIEQKKYTDLEVGKNIGGNLHLSQLDLDGSYEEIMIDTTGAKQLIKVLQEFVDEN